MKTLVIIISSIFGIILGLFVGGYLLFVDSIYDIYTLITTNTLTSPDLLILPIIKIILAGPIGMSTFYATSIIGVIISNLFKK